MQMSLLMPVIKYRLLKAMKTNNLTVFVIYFQASTNFEATEVVITKEMEEEEKQLMEEGERKEQEMMRKV